MSEHTTQPAGEQCCYRVRRISGSEREMCSCGIQPAADGSVEEIADAAARQTRVAHSYYGELTAWVWLARPNEHYRRPVPDDAARFVNRSGQPTVRANDRVPNERFG